MWPNNDWSQTWTSRSFSTRDAFTCRHSLWKTGRLFSRTLPAVQVGLFLSSQVPGDGSKVHRSEPTTHHIQTSGEINGELFWEWLLEHVGLFCSQMTGQVKRELMALLIWFSITLGRFQKFLYRLLFLWYSFPGVKFMALPAPCLLVAFVSSMLKRSRSLEQIFSEAFILWANVQRLLSSLHFHGAISNLVAHCISIPQRCQIFRIYNGMINWQADAQANNRLQRTSY